jgi:hypothetical protein
MTTRELYNATINYLNGSDEIGAEDLRNEFEAMLTKMDEQAEKRRVKAAEVAAAKQAEKAPIRDALFAVMDVETPKTASMLIEEAGLEDVKPASVPSLMRPLVESGLVAKVDVKVTGKGTQRGYVKA